MTALSKILFQQITETLYIIVFKSVFINQISTLVGIIQIDIFRCFIGAQNLEIGIQHGGLNTGHTIICAHVACC